MCRRMVPIRAAPILAALILVIALPVQGAVPAGDRAATTTIEIKVVGCDGCRIQAVQNVDGALTYRSRTQRVESRKVEFVVPTERTSQMAFIVYARFDEVAQAGFPMVVIVGWKDKEAGELVGSSFAAGAHQGSGCWAGTTEPRVTNKLVVTKVHVREPVLGPGRFTAAAGHLTRAFSALPYFGRRTASEMHVEDPSICR